MLETLIGLLGMAVIGVIGWAFALNSRVSVLESDKGSLKELLDAKLEVILVEQRGQSARLARIEMKLDKES